MRTGNRRCKGLRLRELGPSSDPSAVGLEDQTVGWGEAQSRRGSGRAQSSVQSLRVLCQINQPSVTPLWACLGAGDPEMGPDLEGNHPFHRGRELPAVLGKPGAVPGNQGGLPGRGSPEQIPLCKPAGPGMRHNQGTARPREWGCCGREIR